MIYKFPFVISFFNYIIVMIQEWLVNLIDNEYCIWPLILFNLSNLIESDEYYSLLSTSLRREFNWYVLLAMLLEEDIFQIGGLSCNINHSIRHLIVNSLSYSANQHWFSMTSRHFNKYITILLKEQVEYSTRNWFLPFI